MEGPAGHEFVCIERSGTRYCEALRTTGTEKKDFICDSLSRACSMVTPDGYKTLYDYGHYTLEGAAFFGERLAAIDWLRPLVDVRSNL